MMKRTFEFLFFLVIAVFASTAASYMVLSMQSTSVNINYITNPRIQQNEILSLNQLYESVSPSVVSVTSERWIDANEIIRQGTGFFIDEKHVVTNNHVVENSDSVELELSNGEKVEGVVVGNDKYSDLAVIKVLGETNSTPLTLANSSYMAPGTPVVALGNPFGLKGSITSGIISAQGRILRTHGDFVIVNVLQTDAPINPGNSGGPLINLDGLVVGVNVAKEGDNVGFAIPSNTVKRIVPVLILGGQYRHPWIGIVAQPVTSKLASQLELKSARGLHILQINEGGPADLAGLTGSDKLKKTEKSSIMSGGDVLTHINSHTMDSFQDLMNYLEEETEVGQNISITYIRNGEAKNTTLIIGERP